MIPGAGLTAAQCAQAGALALPASLPPARGNAHADDVQAATFGHRVFFDARFSGNLNVRCATCHQTERSFQDDAPTPPGFTLSRNTPSIINAARLSYQFWDGRADSLWSQALIPFENPAEMNFSRLEIAHLIDSTFRTRYEPVFGTLPDFTDLQRFPASGAPGSPGFDGMSAADQDLINRVAANVGKAVEAYERRVAAGPSRLDAWLAGDKTALTTQEVSGLAVAARAGCLSCHSGPMLTDERYYNLGVPLQPGAAPDPGRAKGLALQLASPFNAQGHYFDGPPPPPDDRDRASPALFGAFRTPSLRNLSRTAPYGHNGIFSTLEQAVDFHLQVTPGAPTKTDQLTRPALSITDRAALLAFLRALDGKYPGLPWSDWPRG